MKDKTLLVTGGTGSFGVEFVRSTLEQEPKSVRVYSRGELLQEQVAKHFNDDRLRFLIGDVRDYSRLYRAMQGVDIVIHAAALKHVPSCEYNPIEAIATNIGGAQNIINAAINSSVQQVIAISTDKAVQPINIYGATKMVMEKLMTNANVYGSTRFACVRYGNVVNSRGSVIPLFKRQKDEGGKLTVTDPEMTRFLITLQMGVQLVFTALSTMQGGEVYVPKIPAVKIMDLAEGIAPGAEIEYIGIRPGEKVHEVLITKEEGTRTYDCGDYYIVEPEFYTWDREPIAGKLVPSGFIYASDTSLGEVKP